jgi:hypothetical protein
LATARDAGLVRVVDGSHILYTDKIESFGEADGHALLERLYREITDSLEVESIVEGADRDETGGPWIVIDDVTLLLYYGIPATSIVRWVNELRSVLQKVNHPGVGSRLLNSRVGTR